MNYSAVVQARLELVDSTRNEYLRLLEGVVNKLGNRLNSAIADGQRNSSLVDAATARAQAQQILTDSGYYRVTGNLLSKGYQTILNDSVDIYNKLYPKGSMLRFEGVDEYRINQIRELHSQIFQDFGAQHATTMQKILVEVNFGTMNINDAARLVESQVEDRIKSQAYTIVNTNVHAFERQANFEIAKAGGLTKFVYVGPQDKITRQFCREQEGKVRTMEEWEGITAPDSPGPVPIYGGGYNCRHEIVPIVDDEEVEVE